MTTIQVSITREDIEAAQQLREQTDEYHPSCQCPTALALRKLLPRATVGCYSANSGAREDGRLHSDDLQLPITVQQFITDFDAGRAVQPLVFELEVPDGN
jgi:hypothetical protein